MQWKTVKWDIGADATKRKVAYFYEPEIGDYNYGKTHYYYREREPWCWHEVKNEKWAQPFGGLRKISNPTCLITFNQTVLALFLLIGSMDKKILIK
jgi:hypothetical protein